ncbi:MAG: hypothetical protein IIA45_09975 [Bacteroidetes bacterium]|nr:hypothetical protein [Bacteroidota bacterium]
MIKYALISCILISFLFSGNIAAQKPNQTTFEGPTANLKTLDMDKLTSIKDEGTKYKTFFLDAKPFSGWVK